MANRREDHGEYEDTSRRGVDAGYDYALGDFGLTRKIIEQLDGYAAEVGVKRGEALQQLIVKGVKGNREEATVNRRPLQASPEEIERINRTGSSVRLEKGGRDDDGDVVDSGK